MAACSNPECGFRNHYNSFQSMLAIVARYELCKKQLEETQGHLEKYGKVIEAHACREARVIHEVKEELRAAIAAITPDEFFNSTEKSRRERVMMVTMVLNRVRSALGMKLLEWKT